jgi:hypothetical protein
MTFMRTTFFLTAEKKPRALMTLIVAAFMTIGPFSQAARPNDNAASQSFWCRARLDAINHRLGHAGHASVGRQNLRSTTERPLPCVRKM